MHALTHVHPHFTRVRLRAHMVATHSLLIKSDVSRNVIVLDNLEEKLYASAQPPLNLAHLRIVVKTVAKFHAVSLCYKKTIFDSFVQHSEQVQASKNMDDVEIEGENIVLTGRMGLFDR